VVNERASRTHEAAFLAYHPAPSRARAALVQVLQGEPAVLRPWLKKQRPDVIIVSKHGMIAPIRKLLGAAGAAMSFVVISIEESLGTASGVDPGHEMVAANAVDLVIGQMLRNETGIPEHPKELLFAGHWVEGSTLRPQPREAAVVLGRATVGFFGRKEAQKSAKRIFVRLRRLRHSSLGSGLVFWFGVTNQYPNRVLDRKSPAISLTQNPLCVFCASLRLKNSPSQNPAPCCGSVALRLFAAKKNKPSLRPTA
jgi:hypothetical protein